MRKTIDDLASMWKAKRRDEVIDSLRGMEPLQAALVAAYIMDELDEWNRNVFRRTIGDILNKNT